MKWGLSSAWHQMKEKVLSRVGAFWYTYKRALETDTPMGDSESKHMMLQMGFPEY